MAARRPRPRPQAGPVASEEEIDRLVGRWRREALDFVGRTKEYRLDPKAVWFSFGESKRREGPSFSRKGHVSAVHLETSIEASMSWPEGNYSRAQAERLKEALKLRLFAELQCKVSRNIWLPSKP